MHEILSRHKGLPPLITQTLLEAHFGPFDINLLNWSQAKGVLFRQKVVESFPSHAKFPNDADFVITGVAL